MKQPAIAVTSTTQMAGEVRRVRTNSAYTDAVRAAGMRPYVLPVLQPADAPLMLDGIDGLLLTGGEDVAPARYDAAPHPLLGDVNAERDAFEIALVLEAQRRRIPTLAICRGIQLANVALGGTLVQDIGDEWPHALQHEGASARNDRVHAILIEEHSRLAKALGATAIDVNSLHHQAIRDAAPALRIVARAPDGVIEGAESADDSWWLLGAQWHPEELINTAAAWDRNLFNALARAIADA